MSKDGDGSRKSPSVAMGHEETKPGDGVIVMADDPRLEAFERDLASVLVERAVLAEALEQIEASWLSHDNICTGCGADRDDSRIGLADPHRHDCRFVRVRDALRKALGR